jgi:signal transduction histidine kinase
MVLPMLSENAKTEEMLRVHRNLFAITFSIICCLIIFILSFSIISKNHAFRILSFDVAADRIYLDFEQVSTSMQNFYDELAEAQPSRPYIETLQADLEGKLAQLESSVEQLSTELELVGSEADPLLVYVLPRLNAFAKRAQLFLTTDFETLKAHYARPIITNLEAARSSRVGKTLEDISTKAREQQALNIVRFHKFIVIAIALSLFMLLFVWRWMVRPALARQQSGIIRERAFSADLARKNAELHQAESKMRVLYEDARRGLHARAEFLGVVSHELRTPLNAVIGFSDILKNESFGKHTIPAYRDYANDIHKSGQHLLEIVSDILEYTRFESDKVILDEERLIIGELFEDVSNILAEKVSGSLDFQDRSGPDKRLYVDRRLVTQALVNIIDNAIKFSPADSTVTIMATIVTGGNFAIQVTDQGIGIERESIPRLLRPFEQVESTLSRSAGGLGLGLAIANKVTQAHDGHVHIDSTIDQGSCVSLIFPADRLVSVMEPATTAINIMNSSAIARHH